MLKAILRPILRLRPVVWLLRRLSGLMDRALADDQTRFLAADSLTNERVDALERIVEETLKVATPREKQRLFARLSERAATDQHTFDYAIQVFHNLRRTILEHAGRLDGLRVLELGPGHTLVPGLLLYVHGVASYVSVDLFPLAGKSSELYRPLRKLLENGPVLVPVADLAAARALALHRLDAAVTLTGELAVFDATKVDSRSPVEAEKLPFEAGSFDVVISNAAFEHFHDPGAAVRECSRVLAPGGVGLHQIDLRDHRDYAKPLEFLRDTDAEWRARHKDLFCFTNRWRKSDFTAAFLGSGVSIEKVDVSLKTTVTAADRAAFDARFRDRAQDDLEALSVYFVVKKAP